MGGDPLFPSFQTHGHPDPPVVAVDVCPSTCGFSEGNSSYSYIKPWFYMVLHGFTTEIHGWELPVILEKRP